MSDLESGAGEAPHLWCIGKEDTDYIQTRMSIVKNLKPPRNAKQRMRTAVHRGMRSRATNAGTSTNATKDRPFIQSVSNVKGIIS